jgi:hypothetical protein
MNEEAWKRDLEAAVKEIQSNVRQLRDGLANDLTRVLASLERIELTLSGRRG